MVEENERIDYGQWLPESFAKCYPLAAARTIIIEGNRESLYRSPLDILIDRGVINADQYRAGRFLIKLRQAINNNLRTDRIVMEYIESGEPLNNTMGPGAMLDAITEHLKPWQAQMIDRVCLQRQRQDYGFQERILTNNDYRWISHCCNSVKKSLDQLKINIDVVLDSANNEHRAVGETAPRICEGSL